MGVLNKDTFTVGEGSSAIKYEREGSVDTESTSGNPPEVTIPEMTATPVVVGKKETTKPDGTTTVEPSVYYIFNSEGINAIGAWLSSAELAASLMEWPVIIASILVVIGIALAIATPLKKLGIGIGVGGAILGTLAYLLIQYSAIILIIIGMIVVIGIVCGIFYIRKQDRAITDTVESVEIIKDNYMNSEQKKEAFDCKTGSVARLQANGTRRLVRKKRENLGIKRRF
jgi:uncharacterized membrane protein